MTNTSSCAPFGVDSAVFRSPGADFTDSGEYGCVLTSRIPTTDTDHEALDIQYAQLTVIGE